MKRVALHSLGCKVNSYETDAMTQLFVRSGYEIVPFTEQADIYVINTCTVTNIADRKSRQMLHRARKQNPKAVVVAAGCYAQADHQRLLQDLTVDLVVGNDQKGKIVALVEQLEEKSAVTDISQAKEYEGLSITSTAEHTRAYVKIQDGCNQFCSYCRIPYVRGRVRSRQNEDVLEEAARLAAGGYQEIVLTGIHLSSYGTDRGEQDALLRLMEELHEIRGIERIRLSSLEPRIITENFAGQLSRLPKVCPHFHLSLQSGCDGVLSRMNRHYTTEEYAKACELLRDYFDNPAITADVIAGFPGETEEEFETTVSFLKRIRFAEAHIFKYSRREGTRADVMPDQVPEPVKTARSGRLLELTEQLAKEYVRSWIGREVSVLFEEQVMLGGKLYWTGHTREYVKAALLCEACLENQIRTVMAEEISPEGFLICILKKQ